jgi:WD40 repeat protein
MFILAIATWLHILGALLVAIVAAGPATYSLVGGEGEFTVLGITGVADSSFAAIAGGLGIGLLALGWAAWLFWECLGMRTGDAAGAEETSPPVAPSATLVGPVRLGLDAEGEGEPGTELLRIGQEAWTLAFTADRSLMTVGTDGARLWDVATARELLHLPDAAGLVAISPDGAHIAFSRDPYEIVLRSLGAEATERSLRHRGSAWTRGFGSLSALAFSADGQRLASAADPDTRVWSVADGSELLRLPTGATEFDGVHVAFSPDGRHLATTRSEHAAQLWDARDGRRLHRLDHPYMQNARRLAFSPDGRRLATHCTDDATVVWHVESARRLMQVSGAAGRRHGLSRTPAWTPDGDRLVVPSGDGTVGVWDVSSEIGAVETLRIRHCAAPPDPKPWPARAEPGGPTAVAVSPDGRLLAAGGGGVVRVFRIPPGPR